MDNAGFDPATYRLQSDHSTDWANYPKKLCHIHYLSENGLKRKCSKWSPCILPKNSIQLNKYDEKWVFRNNTMNSINLSERVSPNFISITAHCTLSLFFVSLQIVLTAD